MQIEQLAQPQGGRFQAAAEGQEPGRLDYVRLSDTPIGAKHTRASGAARGRGMAEKLPQRHPELLEHSA